MTLLRALMTVFVVSVCIQVSENARINKRFMFDTMFSWAKFFMESPHYAECALCKCEDVCAVEHLFHVNNETGICGKDLWNFIDCKDHHNKHGDSQSLTTNLPSPTTTSTAATTETTTTTTTMSPATATTPTSTTKAPTTTTTTTTSSATRTTTESTMTPTTTTMPTTTTTTVKMTTTSKPATITLDYIQETFCANKHSVACSATVDPICGSDKIVYLNKCEYSKAICNNPALQKMIMSFCATTM